MNLIIPITYAAVGALVASLCWWEKVRRLQAKIDMLEVQWQLRDWQPTLKHAGPIDPMPYEIDE